MAFFSSEFFKQFIKPGHSSFHFRETEAQRLLLVKGQPVYSKTMVTCRQDMNYQGGMV